MFEAQARLLCQTHDATRMSIMPVKRCHVTVKSIRRETVFSCSFFFKNGVPMMVRALPNAIGTPFLRCFIRKCYVMMDAVTVTKCLKAVLNWTVQLRMKIFPREIQVVQGVTGAHASWMRRDKCIMLNNGQCCYDTACCPL